MKEKTAEALSVAGEHFHASDDRMPDTRFFSDLSCKQKELSIG